jgi:hypothetical protein
MKNPKQFAPDEEYRCERCWSESNINLHPRKEFLGEEAKGFVILCERCKGEIPTDKDPTVFEDLFLRFASTKEFIQHYHATSEQEAHRLWISELKGDDPSSEKENGNEYNRDVEVENSQEDTPFGYDLMDGVLIKVERDAEVVMSIYESYLSGKTMEKIARELLRDNGNSSTKWNLNEIRGILKNPIYAGYEFKGSDVVLADHEAIVDKETFNNVQKRIVRNIRNPKYIYEPLVLGD